MVTWYSRKWENYLMQQDMRKLPDAAGHEKITWYSRTWENYLMQQDMRKLPDTAGNEKITWCSRIWENYLMQQDMRKLPDTAGNEEIIWCSRIWENYLMQQEGLGLVLLRVSNGDQLKELGTWVKHILGGQVPWPDVDPNQTLCGSVDWWVQGHSLQERFSQFLSIQGEGPRVCAEHHMKIWPHSLGKPFCSSFKSSLYRCSTLWVWCQQSLQLFSHLCFQLQVRVESAITYVFDQVGHFMFQSLESVEDKRSKVSLDYTDVWVSERKQQVNVQCLWFAKNFKGWLWGGINVKEAFWFRRCCWVGTHLNSRFRHSPGWVVKDLEVLVQVSGIRKGIHHAAIQHRDPLQEEHTPLFLDHGNDAPCARCSWGDGKNHRLVFGQDHGFSRHHPLHVGFEVVVPGQGVFTDEILCSVDGCEVVQFAIFRVCIFPQLLQKEVFLRLGNILGRRFQLPLQKQKWWSYWETQFLCNKLVGKTSCSFTHGHHTCNGDWYTERQTRDR